VADRLPRRHDLVWLEAGATPLLQVAEEDRPALEAWLARRLPLVVGRREPADGLLRLGFTVPGTGPRQRVGVRAPRAAVIDHRPPPPLATLAGSAMAEWRPMLAAVAEALAGIGLTARGYGSLVTELLSGEACLRADSDVDVLLDCDDRGSAMHALALLARFGHARPRIDGELRIAGNWAVAWRELADAVASGQRVLAKSDTAVALLDVDRFLDPPISRGAPDACHRPTEADARVPA